MITSKVLKKLSPYWILFKRIIWRKSIRPFLSDQPKLPENESNSITTHHTSNFRSRQAGHQAVIKRHRYSSRVAEMLKL